MQMKSQVKVFFKNPIGNVMLRTELRKTESEQKFAYNDWAIWCGLYQEKADFYYGHRFGMTDEAAKSWYDQWVEPYSSKQAAAHAVWTATCQRVRILRDALGIEEEYTAKWPYDKK